MIRYDKVRDLHQILTLTRQYMWDIYFELLITFRWLPYLAKKSKGFILLLKTLLCLMEFHPKFTYMQYTILRVLSSLFCDIKPCSPLTISRHCGGKCHLHLQVLWSSQAASIKQGDSRACCLTICSSEMLVEFQRNTRYYIPQEWSIHNRCCGDLISYIIY